MENIENPEIKFIIDDYYNYYKCKNKYPIILIIQIIYLLAEIIIMFCIFKKNKDISTIYPEIEKKNYNLFENIIKKDLLGKYTLKNTFESWLTKSKMLEKTS